MGLYDTLTADDFDSETRMFRPLDRVKLYKTRNDRFVEVRSFYRVRVDVAFEQLQTHADDGK